MNSTDRDTMAPWTAFLLIHAQRGSCCLITKSSFVQALLCLAHLVWEHTGGQRKLAMSGLGWLQGTPALRQLLRVSLYSESRPEVAASKAVLRAFCHCNPEGQAMLGASFNANKAGLRDIWAFLCAIAPPAVLVKYWPFANVLPASAVSLWPPPMSVHCWLLFWIFKLTTPAPYEFKLYAYAKQMLCPF